MKIVAAYALGLLFGLGIAVSGMGDPAKVLNFFDLAGHWDPSLAFVMGGALTATAVGYRLAFRAARPRFDVTFHLPTRTAIDLPLIGGAAIFGLGWGLAGFCPGGAIPMLATGRWEVAAFLAAMTLGILLGRALNARWSARKIA